MHSLPVFITDLTIISLYAGLTTLLFKKLKQPLILGYVIAGILAGPFFKMLPSVADEKNLSLWADIGVIFLLFGLGLEFSFKKMRNVGRPALITAIINIVFLLFTGYNIGRLLGWTTTDSLFLGGMISMSSTTIIIKTFEDLNLKKQKFTDIVFGILVIEDVMAILLLVLLPTVALSQSVDTYALIFSALKLFFFLILWFVTGIFLVPTFIKKVSPLLTDEMLLVLSIGLCLGMVCLATSAGFSSALGAFIMGSILAESNLVNRIEAVIKPIRDFFGAIFFVSVGMLVNPGMFIEYAGPILLITFVVMTGQIVFSCLGLTLSGKSLKTAILCGFSLAQVGEFAFIIASLGMTMGVLSPFVYPIIVAVSVITTFTTPITIKSAPKVYEKLNQILPQKWIDLIHRSENTHTETKDEKNLWNTFLKNYFTRLIVFSILFIGILNIASKLVKPHFDKWMPGIEGRVLLTAITLCVLSPFLKGFLSSKSSIVKLYFELWWKNKTNRLTLLLFTGFRLLVISFLMMLVIHQLLTTNPWITFSLIILSLLIISQSHWLLNKYIKIESQFLINLNSEEAVEKKENKDKKNSPLNLYDQSSALTSCQFIVQPKSIFEGDFLQNLLQNPDYNLNVVKVIRDEKAYNIPPLSFKIQSGDRLIVIGTKNDLTNFGKQVKKQGIAVVLSVIPQSVGLLETKQKDLFSYAKTHKKNKKN